MATKLEIHDRVKFTGNCSGGTGTLSVGSGAVSGFRLPADTGAAEAKYWPFLIHDESNNQWEVGLYFEQTNFNTSWGRSGNQIVLASSNSNSAVNFTNTGTDDLTISLVDPALLVGKSLTTLQLSGATLEALVCMNGKDAPASSYDIPLLQSPANAVEGYVGPNGTSHVERCMKRLTTTDDTTTTIATVSLPTSTKNLVFVKAKFLVQSGTDSHVAEGEIVAHYDGSSYEFIGTPDFTVVEEDAGLNAVAYNAAMGTGQFDIQVTGIAATTIEWVVALDITAAEE